MQYYDQHLHTYFSFDSEEKFENYLAYQPEFSFLRITLI